MLLPALALALSQASPPAAPPEFGVVAWERDYAAARARALREHKPLLLLFQEVPG